MKKLFTTLAVILAFVLCLSISAFAADPDIGANNGTDTVDVDGVYNAGSTAAEVISVDVSWGSMIFTYNDTVEGVWDHENHEYDNSSVASWTCATDANKITVTNHSNTAVEAQLTFAKANGTDIVGAFDEDNGTADDGIMELATAVDTAVAEAPSANAYFTITSGSIDEDATLGTITLKIVNK